MTCQYCGAELTTGGCVNYNCPRNNPTKRIMPSEMYGIPVIESDAIPAGAVYVNKRWWRERMGIPLPPERSGEREHNTHLYSEKERRMIQDNRQNVSI
jgi:hypothetical protein